MQCRRSIWLCLLGLGAVILLQELTFGMHGAAHSVTVHVLETTTEWNRSANIGIPRQRLGGGVR